MQAKLNLREEIYDCGAISGLVTIDTCIELDAFLDAAGLPEEIDLDIDELMAAQNTIIDSWHTDDVLSVRPDLSNEQAWEVLKLVKENRDANIGINWHVIENTAQMLYGDAPAERQWDCSINVSLRESSGYDKEQVMQILHEMSLTVERQMSGVTADPSSDIVFTETAGE